MGGSPFFVFDLETSSTTKVPGLQPAESVSWSPVGGLLAYGTLLGEIELAELDGSTVASLGRGRLPEWSPDGETIACRRGCELRTTSPDGGGRSVLATFPQALWDTSTTSAAVRTWT